MSLENPPPGRRWSDLAVLDDATMDRILDEPEPAAAPLGYANVTRVLVAASSHARPEDLAGEALVLSGFRQAMSDCPRRADRYRAALSRLRRPRVAALVVAIGLAVDGGLVAAGTGSLPAPAQRIAAEVLGLAGINVPDPYGHRHVPTSSSGNGPSGDHGGPAQGPAGLPASPSSPSTTTTPGAPQAGPAVPASPVIMRTPVATSPTQSISGAAGRGLSHGGQSSGSGNAGGHVNTGAGPPGPSGGNGNGNAWGHANQAVGPPGQSGGNGNGNAWGHANQAVGPPGQSVGNGNGNGNASGHAKQAQSAAGQSGNGSNGNGNGHGDG